MKKTMMMLLAFWIGMIVVVHESISQDKCILEIHNTTDQSWRVCVGKICVWAILPSERKKIAIDCPKEKFEVKLEGSGSDKGYLQRRYFWPEDKVFYWQVEK